MWSNPKQEIWRSELHRRNVSTLPCVNCWIEGYTQAAHVGGQAQGKGARLKVPDSRCAALCTVHPNRNNVLIQGCHELFDLREIPAERGEHFVVLTLVLLIERGLLVPR